ncbi:MAG: Oligosaccharide translocation protein rft1 [Piccolia ochrophora]|nr:MAG: Oligosaccharide translocation protein rft1 [Piccolia ochrophora]
MGDSSSDSNASDRDSPPSRTGLLSASAQGASFLIALQLTSRALTFAVNQILLRYLSPEFLAISSQLELYIITVLFFARESFRVALQRQPAVTTTHSEASSSVKDDDKDAPASKAPKSPKGSVEASSPAGAAQTVINLSYLSIWLGLLLAIGLGHLYLRTTSPTVLETPYFRESLHLYGVAAFWELLTEPCFVLAQHKMLYRTRAAAESAATLVRCLVTCGTAVRVARRGADIGVLPFAMGQLSYAFILLAVYYGNMWGVAAKGGFSLSARPVSSRPPYLLNYFSRPLLTLSLTLTLQSTLKHILTQGDSLLLAALTPLHDQGIYALASAYGSLAARILFQPIEESCRNFFAALLTPSEPSKPMKSSVSNSTTDPRPSPSSLATALTLLTTILHLYLLLALVTPAVLPPLAPPLLSLLAGPRWANSGAAPVLATYSYYIPLLALNGVLEAFVAAVATPAQLHAQSAAMLAFSAGFGAAAWVFLRVLGWGAQGLVAANAVNMGIRIVWCVWFVRGYVRRCGGEADWWRVMPGPGSVGAAVVAAGLLRRVEGNEFKGWDDYGKAAGVAAGLGVALLYFERAYLTRTYRLLRPSDPHS